MTPTILTEFFEHNEHLFFDPKMHQHDRDMFSRFLKDDVDLDAMTDGELFEFFQWIRNHSTLTSLRLDMDFDHETMYQEGMALYPWAVGHRGNSHEGWKSIALHGLEYDKTNDAYKYGYEDVRVAPYSWTVASAAAPVSTAFFRDTFPFEKFMRVRFMYVEPGGYILPHNDSPVPGMCAINVALNNPEGCTMAIENKGIIPWKAGDARFLDTHNNHAVWNRSDEVRVHMIAHALDWGNRSRDFFISAINGYLKAHL